MKKLIAVVTTAGLVIVGTAGMAQAAETPSAGRERPALGHGRRLVAAGRVAAGVIGIEPKALAEAVGAASPSPTSPAATTSSRRPSSTPSSPPGTPDRPGGRRGRITAERAATRRSSPRGSPSS